MHITQGVATQQIRRKQPPFIRKDPDNDPVAEISEAVVLRCSVKEVFFEISQNSQESTCARVST